MNIIINPGTEEQKGHSLENANKTARTIVEDLKAPIVIERVPERDGRGWYGFDFVLGDLKSEVDIPGIDTETVLKGEPWVSPRLYVNGSSWLAGYAYGFIEQDLNLNQKQEEDKDDWRQWYRLYKDNFKALPLRLRIVVKIRRVLYKLNRWLNPTKKGKQ